MEFENLKSRWPLAYDLCGSALPCRIEGEVQDLVVYGEIPKEIDGTFYRVMTDPLVPPHPQNVPIDGDGTVSAFRFRDGRVDFKMRYVETERYLLERAANRHLFGLYRNPYTYHPCVRAAVDSTANTNVVLWAGRLLALKEGGLPYEVDPDTLDTLRYNPFGQVRAKTFTAHPKVDPYTNELVVFGYEATGLASDDIVIYTLDNDGVKRDEQWIKSPWVALIHDCAITPNWLVLVLWPFEANIERMKKGGHHWAYDYSKGATFIVVPRRASTPRPPGWAPDEKSRVYHWDNAMLGHTGGGWESPDGGTIYVQTTRASDNVFPWFPAEDGRVPAPDTKLDFARWSIDLTRPTGTRLPDPEVLVDRACEFPRVDERLHTRANDVLFLNVSVPKDDPTEPESGRDSDGPMYAHGLDGVAMHRYSTGEIRYFYAGPDSLAQEPIFIPRSEDAAEGDGWVMTLVERKAANRNDIVILDTRDFEHPIAVVQLPLHIKSQIHGNWVDYSQLKEGKPLVRNAVVQKISGQGALEPL
ncbi:hypothetical protein RB601_008833 [Gaeumannomyces tritici]